jgi:hypothetical protein
MKMKSEEIDAAGCEEKMNEEDGRSMAAVHYFENGGKKNVAMGDKNCGEKLRDTIRRSCGEEFVEYWREVAH